MYTKQKLLLWLVLTLYIAIWAVSVVHSSEIITHEIDSKEIAGNLAGISSVRRFQVYLPDGYDENPEGRYPVLYWIPGWAYGLTGYTYKQALDDAIESNTITPTLAVFIDANEGIIFLNSPVFGNWESFLVSELVPFIDHKYRTIPDPTARGFMGWSMGGYTAFVLSILYPGVWGNIGGNDPSFWVMWFGTRDEASFPENGFPSFAEARSWFTSMPKDLGSYASADAYGKVMMQIGASVSPNDDAPLHCDFPFDSQGERNPEIRDKWKLYDFSDPDTLNEHNETLREFLSIVIVTPTGGGGPQNTSYINELVAAGIEVTRLDMPGEHTDQRAERFIAISEVILGAMARVEASVSPRGKMAALWGEIKQGR